MINNIDNMKNERKNNNQRLSNGNRGVSHKKQWTVRLSKDMEEALTKLKGELGFKDSAPLLKHILTIYLTEKRLIK